MKGWIKMHFPTSHPLMTSTTTPFVCISDITGEYHSENLVIYNPNLPYKEQFRRLRNYLKRFLGLDLSDYELKDLCSFGEAELDKFIGRVHSFYIEHHPDIKTTINNGAP